MSFGWAYVGCDDIAVTSMSGPSGSILSRTGTFTVSGSDNFKLLAMPEGGAIHGVALTGSLYVRGDTSMTGDLTVGGNITANSYNVVSTTVTEVQSQGSTTFGDHFTDVHTLTGSLVIKGDRTWRPVLSVTGAASFAGNAVGILTNAPTSHLSISGSMGYNYGTSGAATVDVGTSTIIQGITRNGAVTVNLPASVNQPGRVIFIKDECTTQPRLAGKEITITPNGSDTIDGQSSYVVLGSRAAISLYSNGGSEWFVF